MNLFPLVKPLAWTEHAACIDVPPEVFFPDVGQIATEARKVCGGCTVKAECLELALTTESGTSHSSRFGVYAGLTPQERADIERRKTA